MSQDGSVFEDPGSLEVRDSEAREIAAQKESELRAESYEHLVASYLDHANHVAVVGRTGSVYDLEIQAFWETPRQPGALVVHVIVGWQKRGERPPVLREFVVGPDGHIASEREPQWFRDLDNVRRPVWFVFLYPAATAALVWIIWTHRSPSGTWHLVEGLITAGYIASLVAVRRWWVRRRRTTTEGDRDRLV